jgi:hydroxymethylglutaryl-CoA lyase
MATDDLTGNMPTENLISYCQAHDIPFGLDTDAFAQSMAMAGAVFPQPKLIFGSK